MGMGSDSKFTDNENVNLVRNSHENEEIKRLLNVVGQETCKIHLSWLVVINKKMSLTLCG